MYGNEVQSPCGSSPRLLGIPAPIRPPSILGPQGTRKHSRREESQSGIQEPLYRPIHVGTSPHQRNNGEQRGTSQQRIGKHVDGYVRHKPHTLQGRHQRLVMNLRPGYIDDDEYARKHRGEQHDPSVPPARIGKQARHKDEERVPQARFAHRPHRRPPKSRPQHGNEATHAENGHQHRRYGHVAALLLYYSPCG